MTSDRSLHESLDLSSESPRPSFLVEHRMLLLAVLGVLLYVGCIGLFDLWYPDEPDIAQVAQAMFVSGDWIAPRRMGVIFVDYPPLIYWAGSISSTALGGMNQFTLRLPSALAAVGLVLLICAVGSRWYDGKTGLWAGFLLLTFSQFVLEAVGYRTDMLFSFFIGAGLLVYASGVGDRIRWWPRVAGFALLGLASLTKGPLGLLLPGLVLTLWHGARREWRPLLELAPLSLISLAIYLPWFVACAKEMGSDNMLYELWAQNFQRFVSGERMHRRVALLLLGRHLVRSRPMDTAVAICIVVDSPKPAVAGSPHAACHLVVRRILRLPVHRGNEATDVPSTRLPRHRTAYGALD